MKVNDETLYDRFCFANTEEECREICRRHKMIVHFNWSRYHLNVYLMKEDGSSFMSMAQDGRDNVFTVGELSFPDRERGEKDGKELLKVSELISKKLGVNFMIAESVAPEPDGVYSDIILGSEEDYITNMFRSEGFSDFKRTDDGLMMIKYMK